MTPWTVVLQALLLMGFPRQEYTSGLPFPSPGDLPDPEIKLASLCVSHVGRQILYHCAIWETHSTIEMGPNPLWYLHPEILRSKRNILRMKLQQKKKKENETSGQHESGEDQVLSPFQFSPAQLHSISISGACHPSFRKQSLSPPLCQTLTTDARDLAVRRINKIPIV